MHGHGALEAAYLFWAVPEVERQVWAPGAIHKVFGLLYPQEKSTFYKFTFSCTHLSKVTCRLIPQTSWLWKFIRNTTLW